MEQGPETRAVVEVVEIADDDDLEIYQPQPSDLLLQRREAEWNPLRTMDEEPITEMEETQLQRRQRRLQMALVDEETKETGPTNPQGIPQVIPTEHQLMGIPSEEDSMDEARLRREKKRKGKGMAKPTQKKSRPANRAVVIQEPVQVASMVPREEDEGSETGEQELRWARSSTRSRSQRGEQAVVPYHLKTAVTLTQNLLELMLELDNPRWQEEVNQRVTK